MAQIIKASEHNLDFVFSNSYLFRIPRYQRPYAWSTEHVDELLDDLWSALGRDSSAPYFLGSIVLIKDESDPRSEVVDGQQRLTTLAMILCALRELAMDTDSQHHIDKFIRQEGNKYTGAQDEYRLTLRERDRKFFETSVQTRGGIADLLEADSTERTDTEQRITQNVKRIHEALARLTPGERDSLAAFIAQRCFLVVVTASDQNSAYRIFAVMNARGLDLSATDILKAEIIGKIAEAVQESYTEKWEGIEEELGRDDFRDLFAHIRMIRLKSKLRQTLQADFQEHILGDLSEALAVDFIDDQLEPYADAYRTVRDASYVSSRDAKEVNRYLRYLGQLDNFDWIPPAMAFFRKNGGNHDALVRFTTDLERLAYGLFILRANVNQRINRYADVLRNIEESADLFHSGSALQLSSDEQKDILERLNGNLDLWWAVARGVLLQRLDSLLADAGATYDRGTVTVEHVLPQNPGADSEWMRWFPDEDERSAWTHRLANLVLLSRRKNSQASNWDFDRKKREYFQRDEVSTFPLTTQVLAEPEWTPSVLERRQKRLIDALAKEWRLDPSG